MYNYKDSIYYEQMKDDIRQYIKNTMTAEELAEADNDELANELSDNLWIEDSVTGNGSGSYTCDRQQAKEYVTGPGGEDILLEALEEFCVPAEEIARRFMHSDWEYFDVTIRCYLLGCIIPDAIDEAKEELEWEIS